MPRDPPVIKACFELCEAMSDHPTPSVVSGVPLANARFGSRERKSFGGGEADLDRLHERHGLSPGVDPAIAAHGVDRFEKIFFDGAQLVSFRFVIGEQE